jgi:hypothetical protein
MYGIFVSALIALCFTALPAKAQDHLFSTSELVQFAQLDVQPMNLIEWKVGDTMNYDMAMMGGFLKGTSVKSVASEEGNAVWIRQDIAIMGQNQNTEMLLDRATGQVLKMKQNGKDVEIPANDVEIVSQDATEITVKAGKFEAIHIVIKSKEMKKGEVWINMADTAMDGTLKMVADTQMGSVSMELTGFKKN